MPGPQPTTDDTDGPRTLSRPASLPRSELPPTLSLRDAAVRRPRPDRLGLGIALAAAMLLGLVGFLLWQPAAAAAQRGAWALVAALLAVALVVLTWRTQRHSRQATRALRRFSQRLRHGDVSGALRAVQAESELEARNSRMPAGESVLGRIAGGVEQALGERERRWQARMRMSADWHWETDDRLRFSWVSQDLASHVKLGVKPADLLGHRIDAVPMFQAPEAGGWGAFNELVDQHKAFRELTIEVHRSGRSPLWVTLNGRPYRSESGRFLGYEGVGRDVTEQRLAFTRLAESERRYAVMAELSADWYWETDAKHRIEQGGTVIRQLLGEELAAAVIGQHRWDLHPDGATDEEWTRHRADLDARRAFRSFEYLLRRPGRGIRWVSIAGQPRLDARGQFIGYHGVGRDITLRKRAERLLLNRNAELERLVAARTAELEHSNRDLDAFSRQLAHELRTPLSQVAGLADLLRSRAWDRLGDEEREWLHLQGQAARSMSHTVTALLDLARSASVSLVLEQVDLTALARAVIDDLPWLERRAAIEWSIEPGLSAHCSAALARVVLVNLLGNAAKFTRDTEQPRVRFGAEAQDGVLAFFVSDNGAGFDVERASTLFQPFVRLHSASQFQGTGLGLSIVRRIVERHGGSISASGERDHGAHFVFRLAPSAVRIALSGETTDDETSAAA